MLPGLLNPSMLFSHNAAPHLFTDAPCFTVLQRLRRYLGMMQMFAFLNLLKNCLYETFCQDIRELLIIHELIRGGDISHQRYKKLKH